MIKGLLLFLSMCAAIQASADNKIKYYFNHPVDNSVSTGTNATYLSSCMGDTIIAYINRAKYSLDIAVYNYTSTQPGIATAVNNAYSRGVKVRWIYDAAQSNTGLPLLNTAISQLGSPQTSDYTIMHNKFMVIDANSTDANDAVVWTGSSNWNTQQFNYDYNNCLVIQDSALAHAYRDEFNMMWGGTDLTPDMSASKFGQYKTDLGRHDFTIDGKHVELYFSPSDGTNSHIQSSIGSADKDLYVGMYTFTYSADATLMVSRHDAGVYVAAIEDVSSNSSSPYNILTTGLGSSNFKTYNGPGYNIYHNKFMIVDPSDKCSDPQVLTGSHNWSVSADTKNDENMLVIHDDVAANIYYQSFKANFTDMGGTLTAVSGCTTGVTATQSVGETVTIYPNPSTGTINISYDLATAQPVTIGVYDIMGRKIATVTDNKLLAAGSHSNNMHIAVAGIYFMRMTIGTENISRKILIGN